MTAATPFDALLGVKPEVPAAQPGVVHSALDAEDVKFDNRRKAALEAREAKRWHIPKVKREDKLPDVPNPWGLSRTQVAVVRALVEGLSPKKVGERLCIDCKTVSTHFTRAKRLLGVDSNLAALQLWWRFDQAAASGDVVSQHAELVKHALAALRDAQRVLAVAEQTLMRLTPQIQLEAADASATPQP